MLHIMLQGSFHFLNFCYVFTHKLVDLFNELRVLIYAVHMMVLHGSCDIHDGPLLPLEVTSHNSHNLSFFICFSTLQDRSEVFSLEILKSWIR